jgi:hypothetical protein
MKEDQVAGLTNRKGVQEVDWGKAFHYADGWDNLAFLGDLRTSVPPKMAW